MFLQFWLSFELKSDFGFPFQCQYWDRESQCLGFESNMVPHLREPFLMQELLSEFESRIWVSRYTLRRGP